MGELLCSAPYYQKDVRKHNTRVGEILCTGKGCIACNPENYGDESIIRILEDVGTVNFEIESNLGRINVLETRERPRTAISFHTVNNGRNGGSKKRKIKTEQAKRLTEGQMMPRILVSKCPKNSQNKSRKKSGKIGNGSSNLLTKNINTECNPALQSEGGKDNSFKYLSLPYSPNIVLPQRMQTAKKTEKNLKRTEHCKNGFQNTKTIIGQEKLGRERHQLYSSFPGEYGTKVKEKHGTYSLKKATSYLEMLKSSEVGIYDPKMMELKTSSLWVQKLLGQGVIVEEELLPKIPQISKERKSGNGSEHVKMTDKITQTSRTTSNLPRLSFNGKVEIRGGESVLIIEHEYDKLKERDGVLYRLGFALEEVRLKNSRSFPKFSIIEVADSLGEFVQMGVIKVVQRRNKRWLILVEGKTAKDFLLQNGVVLAGRHFEMTEIRTF